jgi:hypothetical protein
LPTLAATFGVVRREMRVTAAGLRPLRSGALAGAASAFGLAIMRRYTGQHTLGSTTEMILQRLQTAVHLHTVAYRTDVHLAPRLALTLHFRPHPSVVAATSASRPTAGIGEQIEAQVVRHQLTRQVERIQIEQLVRRLATRAERVEPGSQAGAMRGAQVERIQAATSERREPATTIGAERSVTLIVRRAARPASADQDAPEQAPHRSPRDDRPQTTNGAQPLIDAGMIDLNRVTEQVIQAIDRRIIARRERLGSI